MPFLETTLITTAGVVRAKRWINDCVHHRPGTLPGPTRLALHLASHRCPRARPRTSALHSCLNRFSLPPIPKFDPQTYHPEALFLSCFVSRPSYHRQLSLYIIAACPEVPERKAAKSVVQGCSHRTQLKSILPSGPILRLLLQHPDRDFLQPLPARVASHNTFLCA